MKIFLMLLLFANLTVYNLGAPQNPEINDQFDDVTKTTAIVKIEEIKTATDVYVAANSKDNDKTSVVVSVAPIKVKQNERANITKIKNETAAQPSFMSTLFKTIMDPLSSVLKAPKIITVARNIGTCIVNGVMEIITYYIPAPFIPLIASVAGFIIPFEPVVILKEKMPVTSYRRAFSSAVDSFLGTFDKFKESAETIENYDPYMTRRFNRKFLKDKSNKPKENKKVK